MSYSLFQIVSIAVHFDVHILLTCTFRRYLINILGQKRSEMSVKKIRLQIGLDKISETKRMVADMQEELVVLQPQLVRTQSEGTYGRTRVLVKMCVCVRACSQIFPVRNFTILSNFVVWGGMYCIVKAESKIKCPLFVPKTRTSRVSSKSPHTILKKRKIWGTLPLFDF